MRFEEFLEEVAAKGEVVNLAFEERLFKLVGVLQRIAQPLAMASVPYEVVGGLAVLIHVEEADPTLSVLTRDVDIMIRRADLGRVIAVGESQGFKFRHAAGVDMLLYGEKAINAVHLVFAEEKVKAGEAAPNPALSPIPKTIKGVEVSVVSVADLVRMKLSANRLKDQVHIQSLDAAGLITPEIERGLQPALNERLQQIRQTE